MNTSLFTWQLAGIPEAKEEIASVKDCVISRLLVQGHSEGVEASGSSRHPITLEFKFGGRFIARDGGAEEVKKMAFVPHKEEQKGRLSMDPMVESSWKSTDYLAPAEESILLVGKSIGMPSTTSGGLASQIVGIGQMKLEAPPQYFGKRQPGVRV